MKIKRDKRILLKLFTSAFMLSLFTFGGGYVIVSLMQKKFVEEFKWIQEKEMLDIVAISQSSPGAIAINASILVGYRIYGVIGSLTTVLATVIPPFVIMTGVSSIYDLIKDNQIVRYIMFGLQAGVAAVMVDAVIKMFRNIQKEKNKALFVIMALSFIAGLVFDISIVIIILASGLIGVGLAFYPKKTKGEDK